MNLGMMAVAANAGLEADRKQKVFDYEQKKRDAELSLMGDKTEAERTGYRLQSGRNSAGLDLLPGQTRNAQTRLGLEATDLAGQAERQPAEVATKNIQANIGLSNAQNDQANQPSVQEVKNNTLQGQVLQSRAELDQLPWKLERAAVQGILDKKGQSDVVLGTMGDLLSRGNKDDAIRFAKQVSERSGLLSGETNGRPLRDIVQMDTGAVIGNDANGKPIVAREPGFLFVAEDGQAHFRPDRDIKAAIGRIKSGEYQFIHDTHGNVWAGNKATGAVTQTHQGDPALAAGRSGQSSAEIQLWDRLIKTGVAKNDNDAWKMVRMAREKGRSGFIEDYIVKQAGMGKSAAQLTKEAGDAYDAIHASGAPAPAGAGAPASATSWSDWTR